MSYARFSTPNSELYVYMHYLGHLDCCGCWLGDDCFEAHSTQEMVDHLGAHVAAGHGVPDSVIPDLWADDAENFPPEGGGPIGTLESRHG